MPDQGPVPPAVTNQGPSSPLGQTAPQVRTDLGVDSGLIDNRPIQAPLPPVNIPGLDGGAEGGGQPKTLAEFFNSIKTPSDEQNYLNPDWTPQPLTKRYANWNPNVDNEEVAAKNQPWYDKWANGLVKMGATAIGTFAQGLMTTPDTVQAISEGKLSPLYQSDTENAVDSWLKNLEDEFPNYYSKWEQAHPFLSALPFSGGAANFWSDKVVKNLGFTIGAIGGALGQDLLVGAATEGLGEIPLIGSQIGKAALWLNKIFSNETKLGEFLGATKPGLMSTLRGSAEGVGVGEQTMFNLEQLGRMAAYQKVTTGARFVTNLYGSARTEAGFEARDGFNQVKQDLTAQFQQDHQRDPNQEETSEIEKYATAGANVRFGINMALLTASDAIQFDNILRPFSAAKKGITSSLQKSLEDEGEEIGIKEGTIDTFEEKKPKDTFGKIWAKVKPQIPNILSEGVYEEGGQYAAQVATQNYYERKYFQDKTGQQEGSDKTPWTPSTLWNMVHSTMQGLSGEFGTTDGWENILLGGVTAVLTGTFEHYYDKIKGKEAEKDLSTQATIATLNQNGILGLMENMYGNAAKTGDALSNMHDAAKSGDLFSYHNAQSDMFTNFVLAHLQTNRFDVAMEKLNIAKELPQAEFEKSFGIDQSDEAKQTVGQYIDALKERAQSIKNNYDAINEVFNNPYKHNSKAKTEEQLKENQKHTNFEDWKATLLQHTSNIDDSNRRLVDIASKVNGVNPSVSLPLVKDLTRPNTLKQYQKEYDEKIEELEKSLDVSKDDHLTGQERKDAEKQLTALKNNSKLITDFFNAPSEDRDDQYLKTFSGVLKFEMNGQQSAGDNDVEVRKQNIPELIRNGVDANRLEARKAIASKAYDILTSQAGFNKFFGRMQSAQSKSATVAESLPNLLDVDPDNMSVPVTTANGKTMNFKEGKAYTIGIPLNSPDNKSYTDTLIYKGVNQNGALMFTTLDGKQNVVLAPDQITSYEDYISETSDAFTKQSKEVGPGDPINTNDVSGAETGDRKKDLSFGPVSTTDPLWRDTSEWSNAHRRHQTFLFNLGSTDSDKFNQEVKPRLKILPVTEKIAEQLGFPKDFVKTPADAEATIRGVYIAVTSAGPQLLDHNGNIVQKLDGKPVDPNKIIFTTLPSTDQLWQGEDRYTNKQGLDSDKVKAWQKQFREALLAKDSNNMPMYGFAVSRGIPNIINQGSRNKVTDVGLVDEKDLHKLVITIPTQGNVTIAALLNDEGQGIASQASGVNMPIGTPLLNHGGNLIYLNNRKLTDKEASNAADLLEELAKRAQENKTAPDQEEEGGEPKKVLDQTILKYLSRIVYFSTPQEGKTATNEQLWIDKDGLHFGNTFAVPFFSDNLAQNRDRIVAFLANTFHNVNNFELNRANKESGDALKFNELSVKDGKLQSQREWPTYSHYLLTSTNPPLATNIAVPVGNEVPIVQKYSVLQVSSFSPTLFQSDKPQKIANKPALQTITDKTKSVKPGKRIIDMRHSQDVDDTKGITGSVGDSLLTKSGEAKAAKAAEELIDKGISQIYSSFVRRASHTARIIANILGVNVDDSSDISKGLATWKIGQWDGSKDEDFARAEQYFVQHPTETTFEDRTLDESFGDFAKRFIDARLKIESEAPDGSLVVTHSKNLQLWDAYLKNNRNTDGNFGNLYLGTTAPPNTEVEEGDKDQLKDNEAQAIFYQPDGRRVAYVQIFDNQGNVSDIRVQHGILEDDSSKELTSAQREKMAVIIKKDLGLVAETPQITAPPVATTPPKPSQKVVDQLASEPPLLSVLEGLKDKIDKIASGQITDAPRIEGVGKIILASPILKNMVTTPGDHTPWELMNHIVFGGDFFRRNLENAIAATRSSSPTVPEPEASPSKPSSALDKLRGHKGKPEDTQYRAAYIIPESYTPANVEQEFDKAKDMVPDWVQFKMTQDLIHMTGGGKAWGAMRDAAIYVYKNAEIGTTYHEAFELIWQNFLQPAQQMSLYTEFKGRDGNFIDYKGNRTNFADATFKQAKEQIAEEFRDHVLGQDSNLAPKQRNWFTRLTDFIRNVFMGPTSSINQLFKNITQGYYSNYPAAQKNINSIEYRNIKASEAFVQDVLQGMTADLFSRIFEQDKDIIVQLEENPKQAVTTVYGRLFNSLQRFFTSDDTNAQDTLQAIYADKINSAKFEGEQEQIAQEYEGIQKHWDFIRENWNEFVNEHMQYLRVFKVEFSVDDNGEITMDSTSRRNLEDYEKMTGQSDYARDMMTINARNSASEKVKLLFATIADREFISKSIGDTLGSLGDTAKTRIRRENSQVRLPKLASYAKLFNYVLHNVSNINGIYDIYKKLKVMGDNPRIKANANVDALNRRLELDHGFKDKTLDQFKMILSVENALNKQKPNFTRQFVDDNGNVYFRTSIINSRVDQVVDNWITSMKSAKGVTAGKDSTFIFNKEIAGIKDPIKMLEAIGIAIDKDDYDGLDASSKTKFNQAVEVIRSLMEENKGKKLPIFTTKQIGIDSRLSDLASIYVDKMVGDDTDSMHFNLDGELTANFVLPNFASTIQNDANNSKTREEFIAKNPHFNDVFHRDSLLLNQIIFGEDGKFRHPVEISIVEGRESADADNRSASALSEAERYVYEINNNLQGIYYTLLPADAKTEWAIYAGQYIKAAEYFDEITGTNAKQKFYDQMWKNLQTEVNLARDFKTNPNRQNITELNTTPKGESRRKGDSLRFFKDILPTNRVDDIHKQAIDGEIPLEGVITKDDFAGLMQAWVQDKADKGFKYLTDRKIFSESDRGNLHPNGLLTEFVNRHLGNSKYYTEEQVKNLLAFREMNYAINNIEMHKFFFGDPAQYSDEMKRIKSFLSGREWSHVDYLGTAEGFNQAATALLNKVNGVELQQGDPGYHNFTNEMATLTLHDIHVQSDSLNLMEKTLGKKEAKAYADMNEADAESWQHINSYRETLLKAGGRWSQVMEDQFQYEMAYERQAKQRLGDYKYSSDKLEAQDMKTMRKGANPDAFFYITKPIHSGVQAVGDTAVISLDKTSTVPLFYRMAEDKGLLGVYNAMSDNGFDYVRVESAHKVGIQDKSLIPLYNSEGYINVEGFKTATKELVPYKYYGIQVDTSAKKEHQTEGSQLRKQATGDLMDNSVPIDYINVAHKANKVAAKAAWDNLSEDEKETISPIYKLVKQHDADLSAMSDKRYENLLGKLGVRELEDGYEYKDVKKVSDFLLNEITRRELPNNLRDAIEVDPENPNQFKIPLEALTNYQQIRNILWSTIEKNIIRPKVNGGMKIQLAATGWEKSHRVVKSEVNGKQVLTSSELKFYNVGEDGKTQKCEVYVPFWFGKKVRTALEETGKTFGSDKEYRDHILNYLNSTEGGKKLLSGIGFRIPTQRDNSIESFIVKDFMPEQMGDCIIFPSEITAKAGSDFDVDKMNTYLRNFFINNEGYPQATPFENIDGNDPEQLKWYYNKYIVEKRKEYELYSKTAGDRLIEKLFGVQDEGDEPEYAPTLQEYMSQAQGKSAYQLNSLEALENKYFDTLEHIYSLPEKFKGLVSPNDASDLKEIAQKIAKLRDPNWSDTRQPYGRAIDSLWMMQERHKYLVGKKGVGIAATSQSNLNVNQTGQVYLALPRDTRIRLPFNTVEVGGKKYVSLGSIRNQSGDTLSRINAMFTDGYVDIAKGAWIIDMGANDDLAKNFLLMCKWGTDPYDVALFMNQPAIAMYNDRRATQQSVYQLNKEAKPQNTRALYNTINAEFKPGANRAQLAKIKPEQYTREQMETMMAKYGRGEKLTQDEAKFQMQMLDDYQKYDSLAWDMFRFIQGYNWDTARSNDPNLNRKRMIMEEKAKSGPISSIQKVFDSSFIGSIRSAALKVDYALRSLFSLQTGNSGLNLDRIARDLSSRRGITAEDFRKAMLKAELSMLDYTVQTQVSVGGKTLNRWISQLITGSNSAARYLKAMQESGNLTLTSNPILQNLRANIDVREGKPSTIELIEKEADSYTSNIWTDSLRELADNDGTIISIDDNKANDLSVSQIYKRMVLASILQSGTKQSKTSWTNLIPNEHYASIVKDALRDIKSNMDNFYNNNVLYRANWEDDTLVPRVSPSTREVFDGGNFMSTKYFPNFNSDSFNTILKDRGIDEAPKILRLNQFEYSDKKVVKTVEYKRDPKTKQIIERKIRLFQRVDTVSDGGANIPLIASRREPMEGDFMERNVKYGVFKEINKWGDGNRVQEYYDNQVDSQLGTNPLVTELSDELVTFAIMNSGYNVNSDEYFLGGLAQDLAMNRDAIEPVAQGETEADTEKSDDEEQVEPNVIIDEAQIREQFPGELGNLLVGTMDSKEELWMDENDLKDFMDNSQKISPEQKEEIKSFLISKGVLEAPKTDPNQLSLFNQIDEVLKDKDAGCKE